VKTKVNKSELATLLGIDFIYTHSWQICYCKDA